MCIVASLLWMACAGPTDWSLLPACWTNTLATSPCHIPPVVEPYLCAGPCPITVVRT